MEEIAQYMGHNNPTVTFRGSRACQPQPSSQLPSGSTFGIHRSISGAESDAISARLRASA